VSDYYKAAFRKIESSNSKADSLTAEETIAEVVGSKLSKAWTRCSETRGSRTGANPTTSEFYNYNASVLVDQGVFKRRRKYFCFQIALCYSWRCKFL
jgi:hypothetical protein